VPLRKRRSSGSTPKRSWLQKKVKGKLRLAIKDLFKDAIELANEYELNPSIEIDTKNKGIFIKFSPQKKKS